MASRATQTNTGIDPQIAELLGLDFTADLDREDYISLLKERMMAGRMSSSKLSSEETELITDEFKRVKRDTRKTFKVKKTKITPDSFKKKTSSLRAGANQKSLPGTGRGGALTVRKTKIDPGALVKSGGEEKEQSILEKILASVNSILGTLREDQKSKKKIADQERRTSERKRRIGKENKLESGIFKGLKKAVDKVLAPFTSLFDRILKFIGTILIGKVLKKVVAWMSDEDNQKKLSAIGDFFKNHWPVLLAAYLLFGNSIGRLVVKLGGFVIKWTLKLGALIVKSLIPLAKKLGMKKSLGIGSLIVGGTMLGARLLDGGEDDDVEPEQEPEEMSKGGRVPGSGNKDTVPAMLTPGEYVMSKGAVQKYGTDTLHSMNSVGGGSGNPSFSNGTMYASSGGEVPTNKEPGGRNKIKSGDESDGGLLGNIGRMFGFGKSKSVSKKDEDSKSSGSGLSKNAKALLNTIRWAEGTLKPDGYNTWFGGRSDMDLTKMTINDVVAEQKRRLSAGEATYGPYTSAAVGAYQMMTPEVFASAAGLSGDSLFTPANQDKMAIAGYMMGQAGMSQAEIDAPISRGQVAKMAPVWASLPNISGASEYGQPVKRYEDLVSVYNKNKKGLDPSSFSSTTNIASGVTPSGDGSNSKSSKKKGALGRIMDLYGLDMDALAKGSSKNKSATDRLSALTGQNIASLGSKPSPSAPPAPPTKVAPKVSVMNSGGSSAQQTPTSEAVSKVPSVPSVLDSKEKMAVLGIS